MNQQEDAREPKLLAEDSDSSDLMKQLSEQCVASADLQRVDEEVQGLEQEDKARISAARSHFYGLNERFEQLLKFKPLARVRLSQTELDLAAAQGVFAALRVEERVLSLADRLEALEERLDLKDYFEIKRPTVVFFSVENSRAFVNRIDLLSDALSRAPVKAVDP